MTQDAYAALEFHHKKIAHLAHAEAMLSWDEATMMPSGGGDARAAAFHPRPAEGRAQPKQRQRGGERGVRRAEPPGGIRKERLDRTVERAPRVDRADAHVHEHGADWNDPAMLLHGRETILATLRVASISI